MISLVLILKSILVVWLFVKSLRFLGTFLAIHTLVDICNTFYASYYVGMVSFFLVPHVLVACLSEILKLRYLRYANLVSFVLLTVGIFKYNYTFSHAINYFLLYSITVLLSAGIVKKREDLLLSVALLLQIIEIILYRFVATDYLAINLTNGIYYAIIMSQLIYITFNAPILDDCSEAKIEIPKSNQLLTPHATITHQQKVA